MPSFAQPNGFVVSICRKKAFLAIFLYHPTIYFNIQNFGKFDKRFLRWNIVLTFSSLLKSNLPNKIFFCFASHLRNSKTSYFLNICMEKHYQMSDCLNRKYMHWISEKWKKIELNFKLNLIFEANFKKFPWNGLTIRFENENRIKTAKNVFTLIASGWLLFYWIKSFPHNETKM